MTKKKKIEKQPLSPEDLNQVSGGTQQSSGSEPATPSQRTELDDEMMRSVSGGVARTGTQAGGATRRDASGSVRSPGGDEETDDGGILPTEREPRTPN